MSRPGRRRDPAGHHGRGEIEGVGRGAPDQRRDRAAGQARARCWCSIDPRNARTRWRRPRPTWTWPRRKLANADRAEGPRRRAVQDAGDHRAGARDRRCSTTPTPNRSVVNAQVAVDNAKIQLEDTDVRAPITGTIIEKDVERGHGHRLGHVNVSGGTTLLKMANLNLVQVNTLVDETDIGKIQPGQEATDHGGRLSQPPVRGHRAQDRAPGADEQNVTVFPVLVRIHNRERTAPAGDEHRGRDPCRPARQRAGRAQRGAPDPARRRLRGPGARPLASDVQRQLAALRPATTGSSVGASRQDAGRGRGLDRPGAAAIRPGARARRLHAAHARGRSMRPAPARRAERSSARSSAAGGSPGGGGRAAAGRPDAGTVAPTPAAGRYIVFVKRNGHPRRSGSAPGSPTSTTARSSRASSRATRCCVLPEREPGAVAAGHEAADQPDHRRRRVPGMRADHAGGRRRGAARRSRRRGGSDAARRDLRGRVLSRSGPTSSGRCSRCSASSSASAPSSRWWRSGSGAQKAVEDRIAALGANMFTVFAGPGPFAAAS